MTKDEIIQAIVDNKFRFPGRAEISCAPNIWKGGSLPFGPKESRESIARKVFALAETAGKVKELEAAATDIPSKRAMALLI